MPWEQSNWGHLFGPKEQVGGRDDKAQARDTHTVHEVKGNQKNTKGSRPVAGGSFGERSELGKGPGGHHAMTSVPGC